MIKRYKISLKPLKGEIHGRACHSINILCSHQAEDLVDSLDSLPLEDYSGQSEGGGMDNPSTSM